MDIDEVGGACSQVMESISRGVVVDDAVLERVVVAALAEGNVLLEDVPGTGKTITARCLATALGLSFSRIQFTPDLLPADVTGTDVFNEKTRSFEFNRGPLFANVVLADEINRASPKTQAALLEAMEETQVTVNGQTHDLPDPFFVVATQNPIESGDGTFPLPEAQKDRFLVKTSLGFPDREGELELVDRREAREKRVPSVQRILTREEFRRHQAAPERVQVDRDVKRSLVDVVRATREEPRTAVGVSQPGSQRLFEAARARAAADGRGYVLPHDVKVLAEWVLAHRLVLTPDARVENVTKDAVMRDVIDSVAVPTINRTAQRSAPADP
jgi:MoxR-like ATPase